LTAGWFVVAQAAIACALGISTLLLLRGTAKDYFEITKS